MINPKSPRRDMETTKTPPLKEKHRPPLVMLPYAEWGSEDVRQICRKFGIKFVFRSGQFLRSMVNKVKGPLMIEKQAKMVYHIPCSCGKAFIGEMVRRLETRVKEHRDACQKEALKKSVLAEHAWMYHHPIIHIRLNHPSLNRDGGLELPGCWMAALKDTRSEPNRRPVASTDSCSDST